MCSCRSELCVAGVHREQRNLPLSGKQSSNQCEKDYKAADIFEDFWAKEATLSALQVKKFSEH